MSSAIGTHTPLRVEVGKLRQSTPEGCWAPVCIAVAKALSAITDDHPSANQENLIARVTNSTGKSAQNPVDVLQEQFGLSSDNLGYQDDPGGDKLASISKEYLHTKISESLANGVPVICGFTVQDKYRFVINIDLEKYRRKVNEGKDERENDDPEKLVPLEVTWHHAVLVYACTASHCWIKDPAGSTEELQDRCETFADLAEKFDYMRGKPFGPNARKTFKFKFDKALQKQLGGAKTHDGVSVGLDDGDAQKIEFLLTSLGGVFARVERLIIPKRKSPTSIPTSMATK